MKNIYDVIQKQLVDLKNIEIDTSTVDFLEKFSTNLEELSKESIENLVTLYFMIHYDVELDIALEEIKPIKPFFKDLEELEPENAVRFIELFYVVNDIYKDQIKEKTLKEYLRLRPQEPMGEKLNTIISEYSKKHSASTLSKFVFWINDNDLSDIICLAVNLKGVNASLKEFQESEDLKLPDFIGSKNKRRFNADYRTFVNQKYLKDMTMEFESDLNRLKNYKNLKKQEAVSFQRNLNKQIRDLELLLKEFNSGEMTLKKLSKYSIDNGTELLALIELIDHRNEEFRANYHQLENYKNNPSNKLEVSFNEYGYNFNLLTKDEQTLLINGYTNEQLEENLRFIKTSSLSFLKEEDESFIKILTLESDILMQLDSLLFRNKITPEFILKYGTTFNALTVKVLGHNINKLDAQKINFDSINEYNDRLLLDLNIKLFDAIVLYGIKLRKENIKHFQFLESPQLLKIIDKYIEIGLCSQIQDLPNLITNYSHIIIKRIIIMQNLGIDYLNSHQTLTQSARTGKDFYIGDDELTDYVDENYPIYMDKEIEGILNTQENLEILETIPSEIEFIETFKKSDQIYMIGDKYFSRIKVLRCLKTLIEKGYTNYNEILFQSLIYNYPTYISQEEIEMLKNLNKETNKKQLIRNGEENGKRDNKTT